MLNHPFREWLSDVQDKRVAEFGALRHPENSFSAMALHSGAAEALAIDSRAPADPAWQRLTATLAPAEIERLKIKDLNAHDRHLIRLIGKVDVITFSSLFQEIDPMRVLRELSVVATPGARLMVEAPVVYEPMFDGENLREKSRNIFAGDVTPELSRNLDAYFRARDIDVAQLRDKPQGLTNADRVNWGAWWWFFTPHGFARLLTLSGWKPVRDGEGWPGRTLCYECRLAVV